MRYENYAYKTTVKVDDSKTMWVVPNCPFCGGKATLNHNKVDEWEIKCEMCGASGGRWKTEDKACRQWNRVGGRLESVL